MTAERRSREIPRSGLSAGTKIVGLIVSIGMSTLANGIAQDEATNAPPNTSADSIKGLLADSSQDLAAGDYESAIRDASTAIQLDPKNPSAYELRGAIYIEEKLWDRAERDYKTASQLSPDVVYKYKLAEIKFLAKEYEEAKPRFAALEGDERLGDLSTYQAFLCDLLGFHEGAAQHDLAVLDQQARRPAYYFSHAAWDLYHNQRPDASRYFKEADDLYGSSVSNLYVGSLLESRRFILASVTFTAQDGTQYTNANVFLENDGLRVSTTKGWVTLPLDELPDNLSAFPEELREQIDRKRSVAPDAPTAVSLVSFTTKSGHAYDQVRWSVVDNGLSVLTNNGWIVVPFSELPDDQSAFPSGLVDALRQIQTVRVKTGDGSDLVTFTTVEGKTYDQAKVFLIDDGLRVLTSQGWITVPFRMLPDDLSCFPSDLRRELEEKRASPGPTTDIVKVVTFTTLRGKTYQQARAFLTDEGLSVLTPNGWVAVPYRELPLDVTSFPDDWQPLIKSRRSAPVDDPSGMEVITLTTRKGAHYNQVRAALGRSGLRLVTSQGWVEVPFQDLPQDLSVFPEQWRETISAQEAGLGPDKVTGH